MHSPGFLDKVPLQEASTLGTSGDACYRTDGIIHLNFESLLISSTDPSAHHTISA